MWGFSAKEAEIMLAQRSSPYTHPQAGLVECWEGSPRDEAKQPRCLGWHASS